MDKLFGSLRTFIKLEDVKIDSFVFKLHYKITVAILIGSSLLVTSRQYFGDPIDCISRDDIPPNLLDTFCWIHATFSVVDSWNKTVGIEVPYPGVDKFNPGEHRVYHKYYQWVCFVLFFQGVMFYIPRYIWKIFEGNRVRTLLMGMHCPILTDAHKRREILVEYFKRNMGYHRTYYLSYLVCVALSFINVIGQMYIIDAFLGGEFSTYGMNVLRFSSWDQGVRFDPMVKIFPRLTKCTFHRYGSSGDVQRHDAMCILPINIINEKIYIFLWFWFYLLGILTFFDLVYRASIFMSRKCRTFVVRKKANVCKTSEIVQLLDVMPVGEWYLINLLADNMDPIHFRDFITDLNLSIRMKQFHSSSDTGDDFV
ncbi:Innexin inx2 [Fragariocoptes setiger]|uniref:Innexin n=1 Tax=Fragariocoptes setiger TaxID=1670756 RepID=A0ABQ7SC11_9ACAR|nr:Innexin inx2 [Fragariocoptes setiger]